MLLKYILNTSVLLVVLLGLFLLVTKALSGQYDKLNNKKYVKILEKVSISKDTYSIVFKAGDSAYVAISSPKGFYVVKELSKKELLELEGIQKDNNFENQTQELVNKTSLFINEAVVKSKNFIKNIKKGRC